MQKKFSELIEGKDCLFRYRAYNDHTLSALMENRLYFSTHILELDSYGYMGSLPPLLLWMTNRPASTKTDRMPSYIMPSGLSYESGSAYPHISTSYILSADVDIISHYFRIQRSVSPLACPFSIF